MNSLDLEAVAKWPPTSNSAKLKFAMASHGLRLLFQQTIQFPPRDAKEPQEAS